MVLVYFVNRFWWSYFSRVSWCYAAWESHICLIFRYRWLTFTNIDYTCEYVWDVFEFSVSRSPRYILFQGIWRKLMGLDHAKISLLVFTNKIDVEFDLEYEHINLVLQPCYLDAWRVLSLRSRRKDPHFSGDSFIHYLVRKCILIQI